MRNVKLNYTSDKKNDKINKETDSSFMNTALVQVASKKIKNWINKSIFTKVNKILVGKEEDEKKSNEIKISQLIELGNEFKPQIIRKGKEIVKISVSFK